jgi:hypothetical protein
MGGTGGEPRIAASELALDKSLRRRRHRVTVERFDQTSGGWVVVATYGSQAEASARIDQEVALGHRSPEAFRLRQEPVGTLRVLGLVAFGVLAICVAVAWIALAR